MEPALMTCPHGHSYYYLDDGSCPYCKIERNKKWIVICAVVSIVMICTGLVLLFSTNNPILAEISIVGFFLGGVSLLLVKTNERLRRNNELCIGENPISPILEPLNNEASFHEGNGIVFTVGRASDNDLVINDVFINKHHCRIEMKGSRCCIIDLGSTNGTFVNGTRVKDGALVNRWDTIQIGHTILSGDDIWKHMPPINTYRKGSLYYDQVELTDKYKAVIDKVEKKVDRKLKFHPSNGRLGYCHVYWETKQSILKKKYGIDWRTPSELNPKVMFD